MQITESFVQLILQPGSCWAVSPVVSNISATSCPNSPWAALAWEVRIGEGSGGGSDSQPEWQLEGTDMLMEFHFLMLLLFTLPA